MSPLGPQASRVDRPDSSKPVDAAALALPPAAARLLTEINKVDFDWVRWTGPGSALSSDQENLMMRAKLNEWLVAHPDRSIKSFSFRYDYCTLTANYQCPRMISMIHSEPVPATDGPFPPGSRGFEVLRWVGPGSALSGDLEDRMIAIRVNSWIRENPDKQISKIALHYDYPPLTGGYSSPRAIVGIHWLRREFAPDPLAQQHFVFKRHMVAAWGSKATSEGSGLSLISPEAEDRQTEDFMRRVICSHQEHRLKATTCSYQWGAYHAGGYTGPRYLFGFLFERSANIHWVAPKCDLHLLRIIGAQGLGGSRENIIAEAAFRKWLRDNPDKNVTGFSQQYDYGSIGPGGAQCGRFIYGLQLEEASEKDRVDNLKRDVKIIRWIGPGGQGLLSSVQEDATIRETVRRFAAENPRIRIEHVKAGYSWGSFTRANTAGPRIIVTLIYKHLD